MAQTSHKPNVMIVIATDILGGPGKGLFQFLNFADRNQFDFLLCNYYREGMEDRLRNDFFDVAREHGIHVHRFFQRATFDPLLVLQAIRLIRKKGFNIVQTHSYKSNILGCMLKLIFRVPWIAFAHGYTDENKKISFYNKLDLWCYKYADLAVVVSEPLKQLLIRNRVKPTRIVKLPNAVDRNELAERLDAGELKQSLGMEPDAPVVSVIGRLSPEKGQHVFLEAFVEVKKQLPELKALIIGDGQEKENLIRLCREAWVEEDVVFTGHVTNVGDYYPIIDLLVIPSYSEGLPNVLLEAMALGVPVVSTRVGAVGEVLEGLDQNMVMAGDSQELAKRMHLFLTERETAQQSAETCRGIVARRYDPAKRAENLISLYRRVLGTG